MKKVFELAWTWYEDYHPYLFFHENKTEEQFKEDIHFMLKKYAKEYFESTKEGWVGLSDWINYIATKMNELGYELITPVQVSFFGNYIIQDDGYTGQKEIKELEVIVGKELIDLAFEHNKKVADSLHEEHKKLNKNEKDNL